MLRWALVFSVVVAVANGKILSAQQFQQELRKNHVPEWMIGTFTCIAKRESGFNTAARNWHTGDHGIFQISQKYWCSPPGKGCKVSCDALRNNDLKDDIKCAMLIYNKSGFNAWATYQYCR
ncbi:PREDICTED: lysozyme c-1-like [Nicrophorus vespilloides]|uniref:lysozyme n=1 Tax=Nicrophorus vespilloides TaxID=110193 RepID=A0ABM1M1I8_NICVS|nr:PREDICTED: lysozyme c-1-like [Nicrophorus vespilloides]